MHANPLPAARIALGRPALGLLLIFGLLAAGSSGLVADEAPRTVRIATEAASPPFTYLDQSNQPQGFEIDLARAFCDAMAVKCVFVVHEWDGIIKGLLAKEYDAIVSSLAITERRRKRIAFSRRYYHMPSAFIGPKNTTVTDVSPAALADKSIGAVDASKDAAFLEQTYPAAHVRLYAKIADANLDLLTGRLDLVLGSKFDLARFLGTREGECCRFIADAPFDQAYYGEGVAVGLRPQDTELKTLFNQAIDKVIADGTYDRIRQKYFSFDMK